MLSTENSNKIPVNFRQISVKNGAGFPDAARVSFVTISSDEFENAKKSLNRIMVDFPVRADQAKRCQYLHQYRWIGA